MANKEPIKWITVKGNHIPIFEGESEEEAINNFIGDKYEIELGEKTFKKTSEQKKKEIKSASNFVISNKLPQGVKPQEFLGGTMDISGNIIDMKKFKDGFIVGLGNDSNQDNKKFILENQDFLLKLLNYSDDDEVYVGSWFENSQNNNEFSIWIKDENKARKLAKLLGQYSITNCALYNKYKCENYKPLNEEQLLHSDEIFPSICNDEEHKVNYAEVKL